MLSPTEFRDLVSGRRRGPAAATLRGLLRIVETPYTLVVLSRNRRYDRDHTAIHRVSVPVISVGNLTLGGTGKTPLVKWLARRLLDSGARVALVSRGYGATADEQNDEALELAQALPDVPHVQNRDRVAGAQRAIAEFHPQVLLLDDGFQHRRLARDLDIVLLDALEPFGFEHVFPRGTLREPLAGLARANIICLSRADAVSPVERESIRTRVAQFAPQATWCELAHAPTNLVNASGEIQPLESLAGQRIAAFCAIGNPNGFVRTLTTLKCKDVSMCEFSDHHIYSADDLSQISAKAARWGAQAVVCTQKDLVKIRQDKLGALPLWAVAIEMRILRGQETLERPLKDIVRKK
jgi:tetraacyldisaccharide 4'-kinase